jgi:FkbM family methyltransferase
MLLKTRKIYKKFLQNKFLDKFMHGTMDTMVDILAKLKSFHFPQKFNWDWKLEMLTRKYEKNTTDLFKKIVHPGMTVIDIGAHIGYYTTLFAKLTDKKGRVYAFEADSDNFIFLQKNTKKYHNVVLVNTAISNQNGAIAFFKVNNSTGCHSIIPSNNSEKIIVNSTTLDEFIKKNNIKKIDVIKIDIEGGEPFAFQGMKTLFSQAKNLSIIMEFAPSALKKADINPIKFLQQLEDDGFEISQIFPNTHTETLRLKNIENLNWYHTGCTNLLLKK